jgi:Uri superfamily endonuclease
MAQPGLRPPGQKEITVAEPPAHPVVVFGTGRYAGAYLLAVNLSQDLAVHSGRYQAGTPVYLRAGSYVYVGSALGAAGQPLAARVARHLRRVPPAPPQHLLSQWLDHLGRTGIAVRPSGPKRLHWHIDYLLDEPTVDVTAIAAYLDGTQTEHTLTARLAARPGVSAPALGLGAQDHVGHTHLLRLESTHVWADLLQMGAACNRETIYG